MTSEVCLMNSLSVVLAADSATTIEYYGANGTERRYFKGANKIFQLSDHFPIGLMIYNSASLLGVPWEVTVKEFRKSLGAKSFNSVVEFSDELFSFIQNNLQFFPEELRKREFCDFSRSVYLSCIADYQSRKKDNPTINLALVVEEICAQEVDLDGTPYESSELYELQALCREEIRSMIKRLNSIFAETDPELSDEELTRLSDCIIAKSLVSHGEHENYTGLVFAGFGDHSVFPELAAYGKCKFWGLKFVALEKDEESIAYDVPAVIKGFAQTSMVDTFTTGVGFEVFVKVQEQYATELKKLISEIGEIVDLSGKVSAVELISKRLDSFKDALFSYMHNDHSTPLRRVLGVLPVDEMSELAETLINLQSLKEKVTKPSETVGGPVDVAVITRGEGLVWIKRKHYFDSKLNSRFIARQQGSVGGTR